MRATFYTNASAIVIGYGRLERFGWALVVVDDSGRAVAAASGVPPPWVRSIAAAEAWAIHIATTLALPGSVFKSDCATVVNLLKAGRRKATAPSCVLARVMRVLFSSFDSAEDAAAAVWMLARTTAANVGRSVLSDGSRLTLADQAFNAQADALAKAEVRAVRAPPRVRAMVAATEVVTAAMATCIGRVTWAANNRPDPPSRDAAPPARVERRAPCGVGDGGTAPLGRAAVVRPARPPSQGGHLLAAAAAGMHRCVVCWASSANGAKLAAQACAGSIARRWAERELALRAEGAQEAVGHRRWMLGDIVWCARCWAYASHHAVGLAASCKGPPPKSGSGRTTALARLWRRCHPKTGAPVSGAYWPEPAELLAC